MKTDPIGIYIHVPFCVKKCGYCDFCSVGGSDSKMRQAYVDALILEMDSYVSEEKIKVDTVFFGGGTPTLLSPLQLKAVLEKVRSVFDLSSDAEISIEANPGTVDRSSLSSLVEIGINRISFGLQTIHENELKKLGRIHSYSDFLEAYSAAHSVGFTNIGVDLMYGIPEQTNQSFTETLLAVTDLSPDHISVYGLIIEDGTPFGESADKLSLPTEDSECEMYYTACRLLKEKGYSHYEISNYAREGYYSKHNLKYWNASEYIGIGVSAYSYFRHMRYGNSRDINGYIEAPLCNRNFSEEVDIKSEAFEYAMLGLRLASGISIKKYNALSGRDLLMEQGKLIDSYLDSGLVALSLDRLSLTEKGFYVSNTIMCSLL